jgi:hypothetical protein
VTISRTTRAGKLAAALVATAAAAMAIAPAAIGASKFGAKLTGVQPVGATPPHKCLPAAGGCTRIGVNYAATSAVGANAAAAENGKVKRIRVVAAHPGNFRLFLAKVQGFDLATGTGQAKVKRKGPRIFYEGNGFTSKPIEHFETKVKVRKGEYLAIKSRKTSALDCTSATVNQLVFQPPLGRGGGFVSSAAFDRCQLLIQAVVK